MSIRIYIGDNGDDLAIKAKEHDSTAFLIDRKNYNNFPIFGTAYTSLSDLPDDLSIVYSVLDQADTIVYSPPTTWSDKRTIDYFDVPNSNQGQTEIVLSLFAKEKNNVENFNLNHYPVHKYIELVDHRKITDKQLWIAGCSNSHGMGVDPSQRYGQLVADYLGLPVSFLTKPGASIEFAADQIIRSKIRAGDILIWGLTDEARFPLWTDYYNIWHVTASYNKQPKRPPVDLSNSCIDSRLLDKTNLYQAIAHVYQIVTLCKKLNISLLILGLRPSNTLIMHVNQLSEFFQYTNKSSPLKYVDLGTDNHHPGPKQHKLYAEFCIQKLKSLKYI
jgi:hypothetical protein